MSEPRIFGMLFAVAISLMVVSSLLKLIREDAIMSAKAANILKKMQYAFMILAGVIILGMFIASEIILK